MEFSTIRDWLQALLAKVFDRVFSADVLRQILEKLARLIREQTDKTDTQIDDWVVDFLESIIRDDGKLKVLCDFIKGRLENAACAQAEASEQDEYSELATELELEGIENGMCCAAISFKNIVELLRVILPILVDWFTQTEE